MKSLRMLREKIWLVWRKLYMSKKCQFEDVIVIPLYCCITSTRSSLSCLLAFYGIPIFINSNNFLFTSTTLLSYTLLPIVSLLEGGPGHAHLVSPACAALGHACLGGPLPLHQVSAEGEKGENDGGGITVVTLIARLKKLLNSTKEIRVSL